MVVNGSVIYEDKESGEIHFEILRCDEPEGERRYDPQRSLS